MNNKLWIKIDKKAKIYKLKRPCGKVLIVAINPNGTMTYFLEYEFTKISDLQNDYFLACTEQEFEQWWEDQILVGDQGGDECIAFEKCVEPEKCKTEMRKFIQRVTKMENKP